MDLSSISQADNSVGLMSDEREENSSCSFNFESARLNQDKYLHYIGFRKAFTMLIWTKNLPQ